MTLRPASLAELSRQLAEHPTARHPVAAVDLAALAAIRDYTPEDMTVTAEGGLTLAALQTTLAARGQWLPIDPPHPERVTVRQLLADNLFGPRRCGFGTIREHLIGLEAVLADGRVTHSGGKVVKNVAGYDLLRLFVGARDSLGIITAATFKLRPLPEQELVLTAQFPTLTAAWTAVAALLDSPITPVALDLHNLVPGRFTVVLTLAGTRTEVEWQRTRAGDFQSPPSALDHEQSFWSNTSPVLTESILPTKLCEALASLGSLPFLARAANGIIHHRGQPPPKPAVPLALSRRLKDTFDPHHILPEAPL
ncbi:MAG: FAD-binding oxidoreductase [Limisphaerales bacterium]